MPPGPNKRKSAKKKKKKAKSSKSSASSPIPSDDQSSVAESDGGQLSSPESKSNSPLPPIKAETREGDSFGKKPSPTETIENPSEQKTGKIEIDRGSSSPKPREKNLIPRSSSSNNRSPNKKKAVVIEPATVGSSPKKGILNRVNDNTNNDSVVSKHTVVDENSSKNNHPKETGLEELVEKLVSVDEKASPKSKDCLTASTLNCPFCGRGSADRAKEHESPECYEKHPLLSPNPREVENTSWKGCCGIFELCSGSSRKNSRSGIDNFF